MPLPNVKLSGALNALERLFHAKAPPLIGVDISTSAVKMVELSDSGNKMYRIERYAIEPLPRDSVVEGNINNLDAVGEAVKRCHNRLGSSIKNVAIALPNAAAMAVIQRAQAALVGKQLANAYRDAASLPDWEAEAGESALGETLPEQRVILP